MPGHGASGALRFGRLFEAGLPKGDPGWDTVGAVAKALLDCGTSVDNTAIPAGFTYLGQFLDHDLTFDASPVLAKGQEASFEGLVNLRTPRFDLDSLYGAGPDDQPYLYDWGEESAGHGCAGAKLLLGGGAEPFAGVDLPRNWQHRALIGDPRNDEHHILSQLHLLWLRFHNLVVDHLRGREKGLEGPELFERARRITTHHYQRVVVDDFLPRILGAHFAEVRKTRKLTMPADGAMPIEFSAAAYRFGHSMVRQDYKLSKDVGGVPVFDPQHPERDLRGFCRVPRTHVIEWVRFFRHDKAKEKAIQSSMLIDHRLSPVMRHVPGRDPLPLLNLRRGAQLGLPDGHAAAKSVGVEPFPAGELVAGVPELEPYAKALDGAMPLWLYVLREADVDAKGRHLGPLGAHVVGETMLAILERDEAAVDLSAKWRSPLWPDCGRWTMWLTQAYVTCGGDHDLLDTVLR